MTDAAPEAPAQEPTVEATTDAQPKADETDWKAEARKWEALAKKNNAKAEQAAEKARIDAMSESERAVAEAEVRGRTAAMQESGKRLATSEIRAAAADAKADLNGVFDYLDLSRFVADDGEPDTTAIKAFVDGLPKKDTTPDLGLDLGARGTATASGTPAADFAKFIGGQLRQ